MRTTMVIALFFMAAPVFAQTTTTCQDSNLPGNARTCTTTPTPPTLFDKLNKDMAARRAANDAERAQQAQAAETKQAAETREIVNIVYCRRNPTGSAMTSGGQLRPCADELAYAKAECAVTPTLDRCKLFMSQAEMEKTFAALAEDYKNDPRAQKQKRDTLMYFDSLFQTQRKWACLSYPDVKWPLRDGTLEPCPNAPAESQSAKTVSQK